MAEQTRYRNRGGRHVDLDELARGALRTAIYYESQGKATPAYEWRTRAAGLASSETKARKILGDGARWQGANGSFTLSLKLHQMVVALRIESSSKVTENAA